MVVSRCRKAEKLFSRYYHRSLAGRKERRALARDDKYNITRPTPSAGTILMTSAPTQLVHRPGMWVWQAGHILVGPKSFFVTQ
jgi:hypothetical protein